MRSFVARGEGDDSGAAVCDCGVAVGSVVTLVWCGELETGRDIGELYDVVAWGEVFEEVEAATCCRSGGDLASSLEEVDRDSVDSGFTGVLLAVAVFVVEDEVTEGGGGYDSGVDGEVAVAGGERDDRALAGGLVRVTVGSVVALVGRGEGGSCWSYELNDVIARLEVAEVIDTAACCGGSCDFGSVLDEVYDNAVDSGLTSVLLAVAVGVGEDEVTERGVLENSSVVGEVFVAGGEGDDSGAAVCDCGVAVGSVVTLVWCGELETGRDIGELYDVVAWGEVFEEVETAVLLS